MGGGGDEGVGSVRGGEQELRRCVVIVRLPGRMCSKVLNAVPSTTLKEVPGVQCPRSKPGEYILTMSTGRNPSDAMLHLIAGDPMPPMPRLAAEDEAQAQGARHGEGSGEAQSSLKRPTLRWSDLLLSSSFFFLRNLSVGILSLRNRDAKGEGQKYGVI